MKRRNLLVGGATAAGVGAAGIMGWASGAEPTSADASATNGADGRTVVDFHGAHQAGISTIGQAHGTLVAMTLHHDTDRAALTRMMRLLTDDAVRYSRGEPALADIEPELAAHPARLTVTFGFGRELVRRAGGRLPSWLGPLPAFPHVDRLQEQWSGGDLMFEVASDDPVTVAHVVRMLQKDSKAFATTAWVQRGFRWAHGSVPAGTTMRNLFGQVDGSANFAPGTKDFDRTVWIDDGSWLAGGSGLVVRRIEMHLDTWDELSREEREQAVGRRLGNGAPLSGKHEHDQADLAAVDKDGLMVIPEFSHVRRARMTGTRILRRGWNFENGLIFTAYQRDVTAQFVPIQTSLNQLDLLNTWTTPIGSAVFAVPPGCAEDGFIGDTLLS